ncbi:DNA repair protein RecN [bacterium]|nr:DNA repair protein RecN [bacterium]
MIKSLFIQNFILIDELNLEFKDGFNVITGETGAGKSIILNAIDIAFGARCSKEVIKTGTSKAFIELTITLKADFDFEMLTQNGIDFEDNELIISREITQTSSRIRINGVIVTQELIKEIAEKLIDIHSQHETYTYIQPKYHITLLDSYQFENHKDFLENYQKTWQKYSETLNEYNQALNANNITENQIDFLRFQITEIEDANIENINEDDELEKELEVLLNAEKLKELTYSAYWGLVNDETSIISGISSIKNNISKASEFDEKIQELESSISDAQEILRETASALRNYSENIEPNAQRISEIQERIALLDKLKRKYGNTLEDILNSYASFEKELNLINFSQTEIVRLEQEVRELKENLEIQGKKLSNSRQLLAKNLSKKITNELEKLELPKAKFEIFIKEKEFDSLGCDDVEFYISTNISEPLKPLIKVASGGEISRIMLAIKTIFANNDKVNTVIFDEIDSGISGKASTSVANSLQNLAKTHQILAITHQPIIAAKAEQHFYVKKSQNDTTKVNVFTLNDEDKIKALAILSAGEITDESLNLARQLVQF